MAKSVTWIFELNVLNEEIRIKKREQRIQQDLSKRSAGEHLLYALHVLLAAMQLKQEEPYRAESGKVPWIKEVTLIFIVKLAIFRVIDKRGASAW